jgi:hypothetical protein
MKIKKYSAPEIYLYKMSIRKKLLYYFLRLKPAQKKSN